MKDVTLIYETCTLLWNMMSYVTMKRVIFFT